MERNTFITIGIFLVLTIGLFLSDLYPVTSLEKEGIISVGSISLVIKEEVDDFQPFVDYLAGQLKTEGISRGRVLVVTTMAEMATLIREGEDKPG